MDALMAALVADLLILRPTAMWLRQTCIKVCLHRTGKELRLRCDVGTHYSSHLDWPAASVLPLPLDDCSEHHSLLRQ
mgnify:CR=1 FL=1